MVSEPPSVPSPMLMDRLRSPLTGGPGGGVIVTCRSTTLVAPAVEALMLSGTVVTE